MPKQTDSLNTTWNIDTSDDVWTLATSAMIHVTGEDAIHVGQDFTGNKINVYGDILVTQSGAGVSVDSKYNTINIGESANINVLGGNTAIDITAGRNVIHNDGYVIGKVAAIAADVDTEIVNTGKLTGGSAVFAELDGLKIDNSGEMSGGNFAIRAHSDDARIVNQESGLIKADNFAIVLDDADGVVIKNFGKMVAGTAITALGDGETSLVNRGFINGDIDLAGGSDKFDNRGGIVHGKVDGGDGADLYLVSGKLDIAESADHGLDTVKSTVSFKLGANLENLTLIGGKDINGAGNGASNVLYGNGGENVLNGKGGDDSIISGRGNDLMLGGKGDDIFDFAKHTGQDVIGDFQNGHDLIRADFIGSEVDFEDMMAHHLTVKGDDLLIHYGNDTLLIEGMQKSDLDMSDFFTGL